MNDAVEAARRRVLRVLHEITVQKEKSAIEVATLCLGLPEYYCGDKFARLFMRPFLEHVAAGTKASDSELNDETAQEAPATEVPSDTNVARVSMGSDENGNLVPSSDLNDWLERPAAVADVCLFDFCRFWTKSTKGYDASPVHLRCENSDRKWYAVRRQTAVIPRLIGQRIPKRTTDSERWAHMILTLFKPWSRFGTELRRPGEKWVSAYERWEADGIADPGVVKYIENIQEMHDGQSQQLAERERRARFGASRALADQMGGNQSFFDGGYEDGNDPDNAPQDKEPLQPAERSFVHQLQFVGQQCNDKLDLYALDAVTALHLAGATRASEDSQVPGIVRSSNPSAWIHQELKTRRRGYQPNSIAPRSLAKQIQHWQAEMKDAHAKVLSEKTISAPVQSSVTIGPDARPWLPPAQLVPGEPLQRVPTLKQVAVAWGLNNEQRACFYRVGSHFERSQRGDKLPPLRMFVSGPGGTGKTRVIYALQQLFANHNQAHIMRMGAFCGSAASAIDGRTLHALFRIGFGNGELKSDGRRELEAAFTGVRYVVIDEVGTLNQLNLSRISERCGIAMNTGDSGLEFGGLSMIFMGDFLQFPPIGSVPLYHAPGDEQPATPGSNRKRIINYSLNPGRMLWKGLTDAFFLHQQERQKNDPAYLATLTALRGGVANNTDTAWTILNAQVLKPGAPLPPAFDWAPIIVSRNTARIAINMAMAEKFAKATGQRLVVVLAYDTTVDDVSGKVCHITRTKQAARLHDLAENKAGKAIGKLPLCIGIPLTLKQNVYVELGLVNGAQGTFAGFILNQESAVPPGNQPVFMETVPAAILMHFPNATWKLDELPMGVAPIYPITSTFEFATKGYKPATITRRSFPLTNGFAITDYNSQGRTLPKVIVDLMPPPDMKVSFATTYVPLSRPRALVDLRILRPFPRKPVLMWQPPPGIKRDERWQRQLQTKRYNELIAAGFDIIPPTTMTPAVTPVVLQHLISPPPPPPSQSPSPAHAAPARAHFYETPPPRGEDKHLDDPVDIETKNFAEWSTERLRHLEQKRKEANPRWNDLPFHLQYLRLRHERQAHHLDDVKVSGDVDLAPMDLTAEEHVPASYLAPPPCQYCGLTLTLCVLCSNPN